MMVLLDCVCVLASVRLLHISVPFLESGRGMQEIDDEFEVKLGRIGNRKTKRVSVATFFDGPLSKDFDGLPTSASRAL
jgi:hypothetical protein